MNELLTKEEILDELAQRIAEAMVLSLDSKPTNKPAIEKAVGAKQPQPAGTDDLLKNEPEKNSN